MKNSILVVDDTRSMRKRVAAVLEGAGYEVAEAEDGVEALELARRRVFDLVVTDHNMPRMDGVTLVRELRGSLAGCDEYLTKPLEEDRLLEVIAKFLPSSRRKEARK